MRVLAFLLIASVMFSTCDALSLHNKLKVMGHNITTTFHGIKNQLGDVAKDVGQMAKDGVKSLLSQSLQALVGAFATTLGKIDLGGIFGKRELAHLDQPDFSELIEDTESKIEDIFRDTFTKFSNVLDSYAKMAPPRNVEAHLAQVAAEHKLAVRGVLGDALNVGIDSVKKLWYKFKSLVFGSGESEIADPVMIGRRGLLNDVWNSFIGKVTDFKEKALIKYDEVLEVTNNIATTLSFYGRKMLEQAKDKAMTKIDETLEGIAGSLKQHLNTAKSTFETHKDEIADLVQTVLSVGDQ